MKRTPQTHTPSSSKREDELRALLGLARSVCEGMGIALVSVAWASGPAGRVARVTIERLYADGPLSVELLRSKGWGVTLDDCADVSRSLSAALDEKDLVSGRYSLEVSSPGLFRKIETIAEFERFVGLRCEVKLVAPAEGEGRGRWTGVIRGVAGTLVEFDRGPAASVISVEFDNIESAELTFNLLGSNDSQKGSRGQKSSKAKTSDEADAERSKRPARSKGSARANEKPSGRPSAGRSDGPRAPRAERPLRASKKPDARPTKAAPARSRMPAAKTKVKGGQAGHASPRRSSVRKEEVHPSALDKGEQTKSDSKGSTS